MKSKKNIIKIVTAAAMIALMLSNCVIVSKDALKWTIEWQETSGTNELTIRNSTSTSVSISYASSTSAKTQPSFGSGSNVSSGASITISNYPGDNQFNYVWIKAINNTSGKYVIGSHYLDGANKVFADILE